MLVWSPHFSVLDSIFWLDSTHKIDADSYAPSASVPQIADSVELLDLSNLLTGRITETARFLGSNAGDGQVLAVRLLQKISINIKLWCYRQKV